METFKIWKKHVRQLKMEAYALYLAYKDPRVPWYAKLFVACVVAYAFSPIDLIPDFIPILGYVDDLILIPLGVMLARKMVPQTVLAECREKALAIMSQGQPTNWIAAGIIIVIWLFLVMLGIVLMIESIR